MIHDAESGARMPLWLRWWEFKAWFHRCPECGHRPDQHYDSPGPRWEDDRIARMLGIGQYGCRRCGHGAIEERDAIGDGFNQCPHEVIRATCPGCNCPCSGCDRWRAREAARVTPDEGDQP